MLRRARQSLLRLLSVAGLYRFAIFEVNLNQLFARRNASSYLFGRGIDHRSAVRISVLAVQTEREPSGMGPFRRLLEQRHVSDVARRHGCNVVDVDIAV